MKKLLTWTFLSFALAALPAAGAEEVDQALQYFTDVKLVNQDGEEMRLYSDLMKDKVVVIDTMFTTCVSVCPMTAKTYARIQEYLGDRLGQDAHLISISVDPTTDTPAKLHAYAEGLKARPGWYFLTGEKENVELALQKLGQYVEDKESHSTVFLVGNLRTGLWKKAMGLANPEQIVEIVDSVLNDPGEDGAQAGR